MSKKRIPCPHCGEKIMLEAKKCRYCSERLDGKEKPKLPISRLYFLWLSSLIAFIITLFIVRRTPESFSSRSLIVFLGIVIFGGVAYLAMMVDILREIRSKTAKKFGLISLATFILFFWLLFNIENVEAQLGFSPIPQNQQVPNTVQTSPHATNTPSPTKIPTKQNTTTPPQTNTSNKITCTGPDGKMFQTTQEECDSFNKAWGNVPPPNPNEYIRCNISPNCGGGYKEMTRASCDRVVCCQVNKTWELRDKDQCNTEQKQEADSAWIQFCNNLYNPDSCSTYWDSGTSGWYDCRSDAFNGRSECYNRR